MKHRSMMFRYFIFSVAVMGMLLFLRSVSHCHSFQLEAGVVELFQEGLLVLVITGFAVIRTAIPIGSTFATVRHRTQQTKGCGSQKAIRAMVYKLTREAEDHWRRVNGYDNIDKIIRGVEFKD